MAQLGREPAEDALESSRFAVRLGARSIATAMRLVPSQKRLPVAIALIRLYTSVVPGAARHLPRHRIDGPVEARLFRFLDVLTRYGCTFEAPLETEGEEHVPALLAAGRGVLLIGPHSMLNMLVIRYLHDRGCVPLIVASNPAIRVLGTRIPVNAIRPGTGSLIVIRGALRRNTIVGAMVDRRPVGDGSAFEVDTATGKMGFTDTLFQVAERTGARVLFTRARVTDRGTIGVRFEAPEGTAEELLQRFIAFTREHVQITARRRAEIESRRRWSGILRRTSR